MKCEKCNAEVEVPQHCGVSMECKDNKMTCVSCGATEDCPKCCGKPVCHSP